MGQIRKIGDIKAGDEIWFDFSGAEYFHYKGDEGTDRRQIVLTVGSDFVLAKCTETGTYSLIQGVDPNDLDGVWDCSPYDDYEPDCDDNK